MKTNQEIYIAVYPETNEILESPEMLMIDENIKILKESLEVWGFKKYEIKKAKIIEINN